MNKELKSKIISVSIVAACTAAVVGSVFFFSKNNKHNSVGGADQYPTKLEEVIDRYYLVVDSEYAAKEAADKAGGTLESYSDGVAVITINKPLYNILGAVGINASPDEIEKDDYILKKEDVYSIYEEVPYLTNTYADDQWHLNKIKLKNTYKNNITGKGCLVAVLDTGCKVDHRDLKANIVGVYNANNPDTPNDVTDLVGHGTHVAGIIAAVDNNVDVCGVAPDASLYIIKVDHDDKGYMYSSDIIRGINKAVEIGADVINMSLGGTTYNADYEAAINNATNHGILCIAASGNDATDELHYPAAYANCMAVSASDEDGRLASFSNFGDYVDIVAPGNDIMSTLNDGDIGYMSGTSMACPVVSGVAALVYGNDESIRNNNTASAPAAVRNLIVSNKSTKVFSNTQGSVTGLVNVQNIFNSQEVKAPKAPTITTKKDEATGQVVVTIETTTKNADIYYTINNKYPSPTVGTKYEKKIRLDKKDTYKIRAAAVKKRSYSKSTKLAVTIDWKVYSTALIKTMRIHFKNSETTKTIGLGKEKQLAVTFDKNPKKTIDVSKIKWSSSDTKLATVSAAGKVKASSDASNSGKVVTITGKLGGVKKTFEITLK